MPAKVPAAFKMPSVMSKKAHEKKRLSTLMAAVITCHDNDKRAPKEWFDEAIEINKTLAKG